MSRRPGADELELPLTLGHECVGEVVELGTGAQGVELGDRVAVFGPRGCGVCPTCVEGLENYCPYAHGLGIRPLGLGAPGAMAEFVLIDSAQQLVALGDLDPVVAAALTDAGLTSFHAVSRESGRLGDGTTAMVIGFGGLGHLCVQILRAITSARVLVVDVTEGKLAQALSIGADQVMIGDRHTPDHARTATDGVGVDVVFDMVGSASTLDLARRSVRINGSVVIVGVGGGYLPVGYETLPHGAVVRTTRWGTRADLVKVLELARAKEIEAHVECYALEDGPVVYEKLAAGLISGRAVLVP